MELRVLATFNFSLEYNYSMHHSQHIDKLQNAIFLENISSPFTILAGVQRHLGSY